tara:strand:+ start:193 stop:408 length:216 start_codon:yes stop_codon:yes gene_type:complete
MIITRTSPLTGRTQSLDIDVTVEQIKAWENGTLIQDVMPHLSADEREFIISGCTPQEFSDLFPEEEQDENW